MGELSGRSMAGSSTTSPVAFRLRWNAKTGTFTARVNDKPYEVTSLNAAILQADLFTYQGRPFGKQITYFSNYGSFGRGRTLMKIRKREDGQTKLFQEAEYEVFKKTPIQGCKFTNNIILLVGAMTGIEMDERYNRIGGEVKLVERAEPKYGEILFWGSWGVQVWNKDNMPVDDTRNADGLVMTYKGKSFDFQTNSGSFLAPVLEFKKVGSESEAEVAYKQKLKGAYFVFEEFLKSHWEEGGSVESEYDDAEDAHHGDPPAIPPAIDEPPADNDDLPF